MAFFSSRTFRPIIAGGIWPLLRALAVAGLAAVGSWVPSLAQAAGVAAARRAQAPLGSRQRSVGSRVPKIARAWWMSGVRVPAFAYWCAAAWLAPANERG